MFRPFALPVACCCAMIETGQTFSLLETDATTPNIVGQHHVEIDSVVELSRTALLGCHLVSSPLREAALWQA